MSQRSQKCLKNASETTVIDKDNCDFIGSTPK